MFGLVSGVVAMGCALKKFSVLVLGSLLSAFLVPVAAQATTVPDPTIHFTFDNTLTPVSGNGTLTPEPSCSSVSNNTPCNSTSGFGSDVGGGYWEWTSTTQRGGGFTLATAQDLGKTYTITLRFSFNQVSGYRKIVDYLNRGSDTGFYVLSGRINFYPLGTGTTIFAAGDVLDLVAVRTDSANQQNPNEGVFTVYLNQGGTLTQLLQVTDTQGTSIPHQSGGQTILGFFYDDNATTAEATPTGKIWDLKLWRNYALTQAEVQTVTTQSQVAPAQSPAQAAPAPYSGPMVTSASVASANLNLVGSRLSGVTRALVKGLDCKIITRADGSMALELPAGLQPGTHDLVLYSDYGVLTVQSAFRTSRVGLPIDSKVWTKRVGNQVKVVGKNITGVGRVDYIVNGRIVSTVSGGSTTEQVSYNVYTQELVGGKNRFEIRVDGKRVWRATYVPRG